MSGGTPILKVGGTLDEALAQGAALLKASPDAALEQAKTILRKDGREPRALRLAAAAHRARGEKQYAERAELMAIEEARRYPLLGEASAAIAAGDFTRASELAARHLKDFPGDLAALTLSAESALGIGLADRAIPLLKTVLERAPGFTHASVLLVNALMLTDQLREAKALLEALRARAPDNIALLVLWTRLMNGAGEFGECVEATRRLIALRPQSPDFHADHADALRFLGNREEAGKFYRKALALDPAHARSWWSLADLDAGSLGDEDVDALTRLLSEGQGEDESVVNLHFALALALHARERHDDAFAHFAAGNAARKRSEEFDGEELERLAGQQLARASAIADTTIDATRHKGPTPIFIVGMPRAGSTMLERMLARSPKVEALGELQIVAHMVKRIELENGRDNLPAAYDGLTAKARLSMGNWYLGRARELMRTERAHLIDKMHMNWRHLPLILRILPEARIIDIRRNAMDCCWSNYRTLFSRGHPASSDLGNIARFYRTYADFTDQLRDLLPERIMRVDYEALVDDAPGVLASVCDFLGIRYDASMLDFHKTGDAIATASSEQVRRPLNREGIGAWKAYAEHLRPLQIALGELARD